VKSSFCESCEGEAMWYMCYFLHRLLDYRVPEVEALAKLHGYSEGEKPGQGLQWKQAPQHHPDSPFHFVYLPNEDIAHKIATQSKLISGFTGLRVLGI
jgi:tRNA (guanine10-N2)-methyltransferase